jgi:hypothetical protein
VPAITFIFDRHVETGRPRAEGRNRPCRRDDRRAVSPRRRAGASYHLPGRLRIRGLGPLNRSTGARPDPRAAISRPGQGASRISVRQAKDCAVNRRTVTKSKTVPRMSRFGLSRSSMRRCRSFKRRWIQRPAISLNVFTLK